MRDVQLENQLQETLDAGANLWVIGDVHGHYHTLRALIDRLNVAEHDAVVMLGDLIDRGPTSAHVVDYVRSTANVHSIRGNHEQMMADGFDDALFFKEKNEEIPHLVPQWRQANRTVLHGAVWFGHRRL